LGEAVEVLEEWVDFFDDVGEECEEVVRGEAGVKSFSERFP